MTIVVGTDFSEEACRAVRVAGLLARALSESVHLVHVSEDPRAVLVIRTPEEHLLSEDRKKLAQAAEELSRELGVPVSAELEAGTVVDQLCDVAERHVADLLVIGAGGRARSFVGGTAERVVRNVRVPVLAVRTSSPFENWLSDQRPLQVLVGSDLGAAARDAEGFVGLLDRAGPIEVQVACVAHPADTHARYDLPPPKDANVLDPSASQLVLRDLDAQAAGFAWRDRRRTRVVAGTANAETHLAILAEHADVILIGARKRSFLAEAWYGSVASGLLRNAPTNVICVPRSLVAPKLPSRPRPQIVVAATDFSALGDETVRVALGMIDPGAMLHVVHVLSGILENEIEERAGAYHQLQRRVPTELEGREVRVEVLAGHPAEAIVGFSRRVGADTLCLGSHGRSGVSALVLGSTSQEVLSRSHIPVLIVPPERA
jgi:nucleotide-binding universal stress UspA family protein